MADQYYKEIEETGEFVKVEKPVVELELGDSVRRSEQINFYQKKLQQTEMQKDYGLFIWMLYNSEDGIFNNLTQSTITRLIYMSTFLGHDGYLVHDNYRTLKKEQLKAK